MKTGIIDGVKVTYDLSSPTKDAYPNLDLKYLGYGKTICGSAGHLFAKNKPSLDANFAPMGDSVYPEIMATE